MIPLPPVLAPYAIYARLVGWALAILAVVALGLTVNHWRVRAHETDAAEARADAAEANARATLAKMLANEKAAQAASQEFQREIDSLSHRPPPVVRVCRTAPAVPARGQPARRPDAASEAPGLVQGGTGPDTGISRDIGPDLAALMDDADRCSAQLRGLEAWIKATR